jgi:hypothetical protein
MQRGVLHEISEQVNRGSNAPTKAPTKAATTPRQPTDAIFSADRRITAAAASLAERAKTLAATPVPPDRLPLGRVKRYVVTHIDPDAGVMTIRYAVEAVAGSGQMTVVGEGDMMMMSARDIELFITKVMLNPEPVKGTTYMLKGKTLHKFTFV